MIETEDPIPDLKEQLRREIVSLVGSWHQYVAAARLGIDQPRMSDLKRGRLERFSLEKLSRVLAHVAPSVASAVVGPTRISMFLFPHPRKRCQPPPARPMVHRGPTQFR